MLQNNLYVMLFLWNCIC